MEHIRFRYEGADSLTDVPVHGAIGGIAPNGEGLFFAFYTERPALPLTTVHALNDGLLGPEDHTQREALDGVIRSLQFCAHFSLSQAEAFRDLLQAKIEEYRTVVGAGAMRQ